MMPIHESLMIPHPLEGSFSSTDSSIPVATLQKAPLPSVLPSLEQSQALSADNHFFVERNVRFAEDQNTCHTVPRFASQDRHSLWYTDRDLGRFKKDTQKLMVQLGTLERRFGGHKAWSACLLRAYHGFCVNAPGMSPNRILACCQTPLPASVVGLERHFLTGIYDQRATRRLEILKHIQRVQEQELLLDHDKAEKIRQISRALSRPTRFYARYLAILSAAEEKQPMEATK